MKKQSKHSIALPLLLTSLLALPLGLTACSSYAENGESSSDQDGDGWDHESDCEDRDKSVYPSADELEDGRDNDCDGKIDENTDVYDDDGDGFSEKEGDCDDSNSSVHPGAVDTEDSGDWEYQLDNDCDGQVNEDEAPEIDFEDPDTLADTSASSARAILYHPEAIDPIDSAAMVSVQWIGDIDGDGKDDMAISNLSGDGYDDGLGAGRVYILYGREGGLAGVYTYQEVADAAIVGVDDPSSTGLDLRSHQDINGDGLPDLMVGDPIHRIVAVFFGGLRLSGEVDLMSADMVIRCGEDGAQTVGAWIDWTDVNGDGFADILIGQPSYEYARGRVLLFNGAAELPALRDVVEADAIFEGDDGWDYTGRIVASIGDLNNDGYGDFLIAAPWLLVRESEDTDEDGETDISAIYGRMFLFPGRPEGYQGTYSVSEAPTTLEPADSVWVTDAAVAKGDFDGDSIRDLAISIPDAREDKGAIYLTYGGSEWPEGAFTFDSFAQTQLNGDSDYDTSFGAFMDFGDMDGDGLEELAAVVPWTREGQDENAYDGVGYVMIFQGRSERPELLDGDSEGLTIIPGAYGLIESLWGLSLNGDNQGDGLADLLVGTEYYPYNLPTNATLLFEAGSF